MYSFEATTKMNATISIRSARLRWVSCQALNANHVKRFIDQSVVLKFIAIEISWEFSDQIRNRIFFLHPKEHQIIDFITGRFGD